MRDLEKELLQIRHAVQQTIEYGFMEVDEVKGEIRLDQWNEGYLKMALVSAREGREYSIFVAGKLTGYGTYKGVRVEDTNIIWDTEVRFVEPLEFITVKGIMLD